MQILQTNSTKWRYNNLLVGDDYEVMARLENLDEVNDARMCHRQFKHSDLVKNVLSAVDPLATLVYKLGGVVDACHLVRASLHNGELAPVWHQRQSYITCYTYLSLLVKYIQQMNE